jgi:sarcosine oxidase subunit gamma
MARSSIATAQAPAATRLIVRGGDLAVGIIGRAFGVSLPRDPCRAAITRDRAALWLGPDEWLLIAPDGDAVSLAQSLSQALGGEPASIVEVSHRQVGITVSGPAGADAINCFNAIDLGESAFPVGMCTRTLFGKAEIVLWRTGREAFRIEVWRSFAPYVMACLEEAISDPSIGAAATSEAVPRDSSLAQRGRTAEGGGGGPTPPRD